MITQHELKDVLSYNKLTGEFAWNISKSGIKPGKFPGYLDKDGYLIITINRKRYKSHRLAWLYEHGIIPDCKIDHKDLNKLNNRITNLRLASNSESAINRPISKANKSGYTGVLKRRKKFLATITCQGQVYLLGTYPCAESAACVRMAAEMELFGHFTPVR